jgi:penicillin-binding protein 2
VDFSFQLKTKIVKLYAAVILGFCAIILRLFYLQIYKESDFASRGEKNFLSIEVVRPLRGSLLDKNGVILASNRPVFDLYWVGSGNTRLSDGQKGVYDKVLRLLGLNDADSSAIGRAERFSRRALIKKNLSFEELSLVSEQCGDASNLLIEQRFQRVYPHESLAAHILGYLGSGETALGVTGRYGLEKVFQEKLEGKTGHRVYVVNSTGRRLEMREFKEAESGDDVFLSLDFDLQKIAEGLFSQDQAGTFLIMDPESGAIRALVSYPNFDPNIFLEPISRQEWNELSAKRSPFLNRALNALYPPASIFKLVTFTTGLEEGVLDPGASFVCRGNIKFGGRKLHCVRRSGHGKISCQEAIAHSCNIPCYEIAKRITIDSLAFYARKFGLGRSTNLMIDDSSGLIPTSQWKQMTKGERWWKGETLSAAIGQSYLQVTPLQIAQMLGSIATRRLVKPRILESEPIVSAPLDISEHTIRFLENAMSSAVQFGSAQKLSGLRNFKIHAKTGTAQNSSLARQLEDPTLLEHGWFGCYFSYKHEKPLVLISLVEHTGSALPALLLARSFLQEYARLRSTT